MSMTTVRHVIEAPTRVPYRYGLFSVLDFQSTPRGQMQLAWDSIGCQVAQLAVDPCLSTDGAAHTKTGTVGCANTGGEMGFTVISYDDSSLGRDRERSSDRARQHLLLGEQFVVEEVITSLIDGFPATDVTPPAAALPKAATATTTELVLACIGVVEDALNEYGGEGVVLVPRAWAGLASNYLVTTGSMMRTKLGTPIAFISGWEYNTPASAVLGVLPFVALRGEVATGTGWNTAINDHSDYAERDYAIGWECDPVFANPAGIV